MSNERTASDLAGWPWLRAAIGAGLRGDAPPAVPLAERAAVLAAVQHNRLPGLLFAWGGAEPEWRRAYLAQVARAERWLREAHRLATALEADGIPCLVQRGPFAALRWYGDPAVRAFADLDLLVAVEHRRRAYGVLCAAGYEGQNPAMPLCYYEAVHYHYPLRQRAGDVLCDLHWAIDHPFRVQQVPYAEMLRQSRWEQVAGFRWRVPLPAHELLLAVLHVAKEWRQVALDARGDPLVTACLSGQLATWVDISRMQAALAAGPDAGALLPLAREAGSADTVERVLAGASSLRHPGELMDAAAALPRLVAQSRWRRVRRQVRGCWRYIRSAPGGAARAIVHLGGAALTAWGCQALMVMRRFRRPVALGAALMLSAIARADPYADDHGDFLAENSYLAVGASATNYSAAIETDTDQDWFRFTARPGIVYQVEAVTGGVWDLSLELRAPDGQTLWSRTNSMASAAPVRASIVWTNPGAAGACYVGVRGFLEFTTGTYGVAVTPLNFIDTDQDDLPDAWETQHFGDLAQSLTNDPDGDGLDNQAEFFGMTQPTNRSSRLAITGLGIAGATAQVSWAAAPWGYYRVHSGSNLPAATWRAFTNRLRTAAASGTEVVRLPLVGGARTALQFRVEHLLSP